MVWPLVRATAKHQPSVGAAII
uniref:Uncharacterized protein n=1 Tax=Anopheles albimanus TaxID=7167 RepID=A0A182FY97_ANOAL